MPWLLIAPKPRNDLSMKHDALRRRLERAERLAQRLAENVAFQRQMIATLEQDGHDVKAAKMFLGRLEATHAKYVADRDRLSKELANHS
jgi:uncharacterized protein (UPF0335 family)